jgi:hypothetical protein
MLVYTVSRIIFSHQMVLPLRLSDPTPCNILCHGRFSMRTSISKINNERGTVIAKYRAIGELILLPLLNMAELNRD